MATITISNLPETNVSIANDYYIVETDLETKKISKANLFKDIELGVAPEYHNFCAGHNSATQDISLIVTTDGTKILIDTGLNGYFPVFEKQLDDMGVTKIDILIATHLHSDHIGNATEIINKYKPRQLIYKPIDFTKLPSVESSVGWQTEVWFNKMLTAANNNGTELLIANDQKLTFAGGDTLRLLASKFYPYDPDKEKNNYNHFSLLLLYEYCGVKLLHAADATEITEAHLKGSVGPVDILKMGHHGMYGSNSYAWIEELRPKIALYHWYGGSTQVEKDGFLRNIKTVKWFGGDSYGWNDNINGFHFKIFKGTYTNSLIPTPLDNTWFDSHYLKSGGQWAYGEFAYYGTDLYYFEYYSYAINKMFSVGSSWYQAGTDGKILRNEWIPYSSKYCYAKLNGELATSESIWIDGDVRVFDSSSYCSNPPAYLG